MLMLFQIAERNISLYCYRKKGGDSFASLMANTKILLEIKKHTFIIQLVKDGQEKCIFDTPVLIVLYIPTRVINSF